MTYLEPKDRGDLAAGYTKVVLDAPSETAARLMFAEQVGVAEALDFAGVQLRCDGSVVERWPVVSGDDPDLSDFRRAVALISHRATAHHEGLHWSLTEAVEAGRLPQLLRSVDAAYRVVIEHFGANGELIDEEIRLFTTAEAADSFEVYNQYAAQAIMALRAEDRAALNEVIAAVNHDAAGPRFVGAVCDVYAGLLPELATAEGHDFLSAWTARIAGLEDQFD